MADEKGAEAVGKDLDEGRKPEGKEGRIMHEASPGAEEDSPDIQPENTDNQDDQSTDENQSNDKDEKDTLSSGDETMATASEDISEEDEIGISLSDDELWDDGTDLDEIPLFEEEEEEKNEEEKEASGEKDASSTHPEVPDDEKNEPGNVPEHTSGGHKPEDRAETVDSDEQDPDHKKGTDADQEANRKNKACLDQYIPWIITSISAILLITGIAVLCAIWPSGEDTSSRPVQTSALKTGKTRPVSAAPGSRPGAGMESINLEPFLLPARQEGELVFLKLHVELIVPDIQTKKDLLLKEAWVRDTIYQELKGITVPAGKGNLLALYRRPLIRKLNREFRPLEIKDIRLSGYLLR